MCVDGTPSLCCVANLATRLYIKANLCLFRTCTVQLYSFYESLVMAMSQRFTPVRIKLAQGGLFHSRRQKVNERVNDYAQDLNRLH